MKPTRHRYWVLALLCSLAFLTYLDRICIMRVQGDIERDLRLGELATPDEPSRRTAGETADAARAKLAKDKATGRLSWIFAAFAAGYILFEVPGGWLGDRWGVRAVIFRIVLWWSAFTAATGGVKGLTSIFFERPGPEHWLIVMIIVRFLFGAGEAGAYPNIARALGRWFPLHERATAQSFVWFSSRLGGAFAPLIIGGLVSLSGTWSRAFWILGMVGAGWALFFFAGFRNRPEEVPAVNRAERETIRAGDPARGSIYDDDSQALPFRWAALGTANVLALCAASFCVSFCFYFYITFLPKYLLEEFNVDYGRSQWITGLPLLAGGLVCLLAGRLSDFAVTRLGRRRWGRSVLPIVGWTIAGACAFAVSQLRSPTAVMVLIVLAFACQDLGVPSMWSLPADIGGRYAGTIGGWMNTAGAVGGMLSPLAAARVSIAYDWHRAFIMFGIVYLLGAFAWLRINADEPIIQNTPPPPGRQLS